jgi:hypothetical protein
MDVFSESGEWQPSLPELLRRLQDLRCRYCSRKKIGKGALLAPACGRKKCRERAAANFGLPFQLHCVIRGMAMGYQEKQIPDLMIRLKPKPGEEKITEHAVKQ